MIRADNMLRVGVVSSVNEDKRMARVFYPDQGNMVSDWLYVLQFPTWTKYAKLSPYNTELNMQEAGSHTHTVPEHTHTIPAHTHSSSVSDVGLTAESAGNHSHSITVSEGSASIGSAGDHTHSIPSHNHTVSIDPTSQTTNATGNTTESAGGHSHYLGSHTHLIDDHRHRTGFWMPRINDRVLVLMACGEEKDGYIMGVISSEQFDE